MQSFLRCVPCDRTFPLETPLQYQCDACQGNLEVGYAFEQLSWSKADLAAQETGGIWRYLPLLPVAEGVEAPPLGMTPCYASSRLASLCGVRECWLKNDTVTPSASFKDRASAVALKWAAEHGHQLITAASTGNAGAAAACWSAAIGLRAKIFLPRTAPAAKVAQLQVFGAEVLLVDGNYDQAFELCLKATEEYGWYNRNTGFNPITREGKKTVSFEIAEQLRWQVPDYVVVSVGDGNIISGVWKGFAELRDIGWIDRTPKLLAVQSEESDAIVTAWEQDAPIQPVRATTRADSISVDLPRDGDAAVRAIRASGGLGIRVADQAILEAIPTLAQEAGLFAEPAAAASLAGLQKATKEGLLPPDASVLLILTGHGLKDIQAVQSLLQPPTLIPPSLDAVPRS